MKNLCYLVLVFFVSCTSTKVTHKPSGTLRSNIVLRGNIPPVKIDVKNVDTDEVVTLAESMQDIPYVYGGSTPMQGFDCSGFVNYVFSRFGIKVPRISRNFTNAGFEVAADKAKRGDIILFTGSDPGSGEVGHLGLVTSVKNGDIQFVHAASGAGKRIMVNGVNEYFRERFVKVIRIF